MIKLINILKEINESKQAGLLYHFTPLTNIIGLLSSKYIKPNEEDQISTTRNASLDVYPFFNEVNKNIARLTLDGDKISTKYKIVPFNHGEEKGEYEEQIIVNGKNFPFLPYLKRIDLFIIKPKDKNISKLENIFQKVNIPYKIYNNLPTELPAYKQDKEGDSKDINLTLSPELEKIRRSEEKRAKNYLIATQKKIQQYIKDGSKGDLNLNNTPIKTLPDNLTQVRGDLNLSNTLITSFPSDIKVEGDLNLSNTLITKLPDNLTFTGGLDLSNCSITSLPNNLKIRDYLDLSGTKITSIPNNLQVGEDLVLYDLFEKYTEEEIRKMIKDKGGYVKGKIWLG